MTRRSTAARLRPLAAGPGGRRLAGLLLVLAVAAPAAGQSYELTSARGERISLERDTVLAMHARTRALREDLEQDPAILYYTGFTPPVSAESPEPAYPWNAVTVLTDSTAAVRTPGNLREADRAYSAYAVVRMRAVRADPDVPCDSLMEREAAAVSAFIDGWIVARTLFGAPPYPPLTELAFARREGVLPALLADVGDPQLGGCLDVWRRAHPERLEAYRRWREAAPGEEPTGEQSGV